MEFKYIMIKKYEEKANYIMDRLDNKWNKQVIKIIKKYHHQLLIVIKLFLI